MKYVIYAPPYARNSGGKTALWKLAKALKEKGQEAYIYIHRTETNKDLPAVSYYDLEIIDTLPDDAVVVYAEVVYGNPLKAKKVVRWLLNHPGLLGGDTEYDEKEMMFTHSLAFGDYDMLFIPPFELDIFNTEGVGERKGSCVYYGKGKKWNAELIEEAEESGFFNESVMITKEWPATREGLAEIFKTSEMLYCFDEISGISTEAGLCGCPTIIFSRAFTDKRYLRSHFIVAEGIGIGNDEIEYAKETVHLVKEKYLDDIKDCDNQLDNFIEKTQNEKNW